ncbi:MAG TPA: glycosyltransferase family 2 protein, partial [Geobacteraceae bacterium]
MTAAAERILVLIPAYNEEGNIGRTVAGVRRAFPAADIVVVDDGSRDATAAVARAAGAVVLTHHFNMGYGVTIQTGYKYAHAKGYDYLVQLDGDGQHDPACIPALLAPVMAGDTDFALGSRFLGLESYRPPFMRRLGIALFRKLVTVIIGRSITDPTSGFQAFNRDVIRFFTGDLFPCDYPDADMLVLLNLVGFRIVELPVRMYANPDGKSMHSGFKPLYYVFKMCLSICVTLMRQRQ